MSETNRQMQSAGDRQKFQRTRLYSAIRIVDGRIQGLCPSDPEDANSEPSWADWGAETLIWEDREDAYQTARSMQGLLVSVDGLPVAARLLAYQAKVRRMREDLGDTFPKPAEKPPVQGLENLAETEEAAGACDESDEELASRRAAVEAAKAARVARKKSGTVIQLPEAGQDGVPF